MDTKLATQEIRQQQWVSVINDRIESGLKVDDYCEQHGLSRNAYYYWLGKIRTSALQSKENKFVEVTPYEKSETQVVSTTTSEFRPQITIQLGNTTIGIDSSTPKALLLQTLEVLGYAK